MFLFQITTLPEMVFDKLESKVKNEEQLLYVFHLVCPLTQRLFAERIMHPLFNLTKSLFRMLSRVQKDSTTGLKHMDEICDVLYHIKYQFIGDSIKDEIERYLFYSYFTHLFIPSKHESKGLNLTTLAQLELSVFSLLRAGFFTDFLSNKVAQNLRRFEYKRRLFLRSATSWT